jgi:hypothetical protein
MANKLYIFGIGGTGSRVIKALSMLFASGAKLDNGFDTVVPIIIDPDISNGDLNRTKDILKLYQEIRANVDKPNDFYAQDVKTVQNLKNDASSINGAGFQFQIGGTSNAKFKDFISYNNLTDDDKSFISSLYSNENLNADLSIGFKGNPNMGSIVLNQFTQSEDFQDFGLSFSQGDAIFIINSIFGGTGAAGFPLILKNLRHGANIPNSEIVRQAPIGNTTYLPYFKLTSGEIDSDSFLEKTKSALEYYNRTIIAQGEVNAMYLLGDNGTTSTYDNHVGQMKQKNDAHFLEVAGALAIFDFCKNISNYPNGNTQVKEFGVNNNSDNLSFADLHVDDNSFIAKPLKKFSLYAEYLDKGLKKALGVSRWTIKKTELTKSFFTKDEYKEQVLKFNDHFNKWLDELASNKPSFSPLDNIRKIDSDKRKSLFKDLDCLNSKMVNPPKEEPVLTPLIKLFGETTEKLIENKKL